MEAYELKPIVLLVGYSWTNNTGPIALGGRAKKQLAAFVSFLNLRGHTLNVRAIAGSNNTTTTED